MEVVGVVVVWGGFGFEEDYGRFVGIFSGGHCGDLYSIGGVVVWIWLWTRMSEGCCCCGEVGWTDAEKPRLFFY